jgi:hypothetical protein
MSKFRMFYSWQSDRPSELCRRFVDTALRSAAQMVGEAIGTEIQIDSDTQNEPGTPPITETILRKIRECDGFVADMTFVGETIGGKLVPNPNVMGEYGYALSQKGTRRILLVMNTAFGPPEGLPFDLAHLRHPVAFEASPGMADGARRAAREAFGRRLVEPLRIVVEHSLALAAADRTNDPAIAAPAREMLRSLSNSTEWGQKPAIVSRPKLILHLAPYAAFARPILDIRRVKQVMSAVTPVHLAAGSFDLDEKEWWVCGRGSIIPGKPNPETTWYARFIRPGVFEVALNIGSKIDDDPRILVDGCKVEAAVIDMLDKCSAAAADLGLSGSGLLSAALIGAEEVDVQMSRLSGRFRKPAVGLGEVALDSIGERLGDNLHPIFDTLWAAAGISEGSISFRQGGWAGYRGERPYQL